MRQATSLEEFEAYIPEIRSAYKEQTAQQNTVEDVLKKRREAEEVRGAMYDIAHLEELKGEADYRANFVKSLKSAVAEEKSTMDKGKGTDDEDLLTSIGTAVIAWYNERLVEQEEWAADIQANYAEARQRRQSQQDRIIEYAGILVGWAEIYQEQNVIDQERFLIHILYDQRNLIASSEEVNEKRLEEISARIVKMETDLAKQEQIVTEKRLLI